MLAPAIARWASLPPPIAGTNPVSPADAKALRLTALRTWRFFEKFVTAEDNMLPPDNFQEDPKPAVAHRTSPTNLGLYLLSVISAHDFGWTGTHETTERLDATLASMNRLERFRGHFYNWYETRDLRPLDPKYVSSVDSGNLAGHLIALGNACREIITRPVLDSQWTAGIEDLIALTRESLAMLAADPRTHIVTPKQLDEALDGLSVVFRSEPQTPAAASAQIAELLLQADSVSDIARALTQDRAEPEANEVLAWADSLRACIRSHQREIELLMPWATLVASEAASKRGSKESGPFCGDEALGTLLDSMPTLATLSDRCDQATEILTASPDGTRGQACRIRRLGRTNRCNARGTCNFGAGSKITRATFDRHRHYGGQNFRRNEVRLSFRSHTPIAFDRISRHRRQPRPELLRLARFGSASCEFRGNR